jgi:ubiquinone/menaquinone biosynthesis C-methylase UbiE
MKFDEDLGQRLKAAYLTPDVVAQRRAVREALALRTGEDVVDVGCGPGLLAAEMAQDVGAGGSVLAVDPSEDMLALAATAERGTDGAPITFAAGDACALPAEDASADAAVATQVYVYVADMPAALQEARRVLRPGGRLLVLDTDWDSIVWKSSDPERMRRVLSAWDEHLVDPYLPRKLPELIASAGLTLRHVEAFPLLNLGTDRANYSGGLIGFITAFVPGRQGVSADDVKAWNDDLAAQGEHYFFSVNRYLFVAER